VKKLAAISLLILLLFNFIGYRLVFYTLQHHADKELVSKLDNNAYSDEDLITITVPLSLPYLTNWKDFERTDGEITLNGKIYHYVKQKVYEGNMILMCLPDEQKMHLQNAKDDFFKLANELQSNSTSSKKSGNSTVLMKLVISDYDKMQTTSSVVYATRLLTFFPDNLSATLQKGEHLIPEQPPRA
jgi:hypothetical protein